ncbi:MAG: NAD-dependent malic enzyme [Spirochaetaceae bacterium]|nr:NAD-dependent malic enzyme [Spirochaetaceae bacterium]|tara:strand:+ start:33738 stop:34919 length:1182 start_codon:yes stop_codon:yes gene_type:complete
MDIFSESLEFHKKLKGKLEIRSKSHIESRHDLSLLYTPGVAESCRAIHRDPQQARQLTIKSDTVAVITDGSAVLGLGNIGPLAALPVMEGKCVLFKEYAGLNAFPICLDTQNTVEIINAVRNLAPVFAGINLEDISAPRCFEIEAGLQDIGIPVFHDDQHGTAIVLLAGLLNAAKLAGKSLSELRVVINGSGAAGTAIAELLLGVGHDPSVSEPVSEVLMCDTKGIISRNRSDIESNPAKMKLARITNRHGRDGDLNAAIEDADVFIGVSVEGALTPAMVRKMRPDPIIFALANPVPEILPEEAYAAGALVVGTGRSDFPNQINNVLAFPGVFRGAIDVQAPRITAAMKIAAARALADHVGKPDKEHIIPSVLDKTAGEAVAAAVAQAYVPES